MQADAWKMNPFLVAQKTFLIKGKLGYEAQLVNSVITASGVIEGRPRYEHIGPWENILGKNTWNKNAEEGLAVRVIAKMKYNGEELDHVCYLVSAKVRNSPLWETQPQMQLEYLAIKQWVRRHAPDVLLGVYTEDELPRADLIPVSPIPTGPSKTEALGDFLADGDEEDNIVVEPEVEVIDPKPAKAKPPKKEKAKPAEKKQDTEEEYHAKLMQALGTTGIPLTTVIEYCTAKGGLKGSENLADLPKKWKDGIIADASSLKNSVNAWLDEE
jgi:hypothetical protein